MLQTIKYFLLLFLLLNTLHAKDLKNVTVQLEWKNTFEFSGFFVAKELGFYKDAGLNVKTKEWSHGVNTVDDVLNGKSTYGLVRTSSLLDANRSKKFTYLLALYQSNPLIILADKSANINSLQDLKNKRLMATKDHLSEVSITSMFHTSGLKVQDINITKHSFNVKDMLNGKADAMVAYISNEPFLLQEAGGEATIFSPKDFGIDFYNDLLIVSTEYLNKYPKEVERFRKATIKGYEYAYAHINETVDLVYKKYNSLHKSKEAILYEANELKKLAYYKTDKIGAVSGEKLQSIYDIYKSLGLAHGDFNISKITYENAIKSNDLSDAQKEYLQNRKPIKLCADFNWLPFSKLTKNGKFIGIDAEVASLLEKKISTKIIPIKTTSWDNAIDLIKERKCDIITAAHQTSERESYINFTQPYMTYPLVAATRTDVSFISDLGDLENKKVGIIKGHAFIDILKDKYPLINIIEVKNINEGLHRVDNGTLYAYIDSLPSIAYNIQLKGRLKISGKVHDDWELGLGVRNDDKMLLGIFEKLLASITEKEKQKILNDWVFVRYEDMIDYTLIKEILFVGFILFVLALLWIRNIAQKNKLLQKAHETIEKKNRELRVLANTDKLTSIFNRLKLDHTLEREVSRAKRYKNRFAVAIIDIDFFKKVNDSYGHQIGDKVLIEISRIISKTIRSTDCVGRWGGEEFLLICLEIDKENMLLLMKKIRSEIKEHKFANVTHITASFGVTLSNEDDNVQSLIKRADSGLYEAKNSGRDKIVFVD